jgi:hypothetical protein
MFLTSAGPGRTILRTFYEKLKIKLKIKLKMKLILGQ